MKNQQQGNMGQQQASQGSTQGNAIPQSQLDTILRQGKYNSQSDLNGYLQQHGLSGQIRDDGTAEIFEGVNASKRIATVRFQGSAQDQRGISGIDY